MKTATSVTMIVKSIAFVLFVLLVTFAETRRGKGEKNRERLKNRAIRENGSEGSCELEVTCKNEGQMPIKLPIRGPKGPPGQPGQKGDVGEPGTPGLPGIPGKSRAQTPKVAFFAGLRENVGPVERNADISFDKVITNRGGAYNAKSGRFTAPFNGTYHFSAVVAAQGSQKAAVMIAKNGQMVATVWAESIPFWATASNSVILDLNRHDQVWLIQLARAPYLHGYMYSTFSGFIIFNDEDEDSLVD